MCKALWPTQKRSCDIGFMIYGCVLCVVYCVLRVVCPVFSRDEMVYLKMVYRILERMQLYRRCFVHPLLAVCSPL